MTTTSKCPQIRPIVTNSDQHGNTLQRTEESKKSFAKHCSYLVYLPGKKGKPVCDWSDNSCWRLKSEKYFAPKYGPCTISKANQDKPSCWAESTPPYYESIDHKERMLYIVFETFDVVWLMDGIWQIRGWRCWCIPGDWVYLPLHHWQQDQD